MIICWNCTTDLLDGTIFCDDCGAALLDSAPRRVAAPLPDAPTPTDQAQGDTRAEPRLILTGTGAVIVLPAAPVVVVGRAGDKGPRPDVDLGPFRAAEAGVSRTHMVLDLAGPRPRIKDLDSTNGTYINGRRLMPHRTVAVGAGDQISLGQLALRLEI